MKKIISAAITPFTDDNRLDLESARRLYEFNIGNGCDGFFIPGTMGEWALLTSEERLELATCACETIGDRAAVLINVADTGLPSILRNIETLKHLSHSHYVVILPGAWAGPGDPVSYMNRIADAADRPVYLYYIPSFNGVSISTRQFRDILSHPNIAGLKNSAGLIQTRRELLFLKDTMDFEIYEGQEWGIDEALIAGCDGAVVGFASTAVKLMKQLAAHVDAGDVAAARRAQHKLIELFHVVYGDPAKWWNSGQKYALKYMGIIASGKSRIESQQDLPDANKAAIESCIDANRHLLV